MNPSSTFLKRLAVAAVRRPNSATTAAFCHQQAPASTSSRNHFQQQIARFYRGDSNDAVPTITVEEEALIQKGKPRDEAIRKHHLRPVKLDDLKLSPENLKDLKSDNPNADPSELELEIRRKRLIYRSKQRGWLEVDVLLGTWAHENVPSLTQDELDQFEAFVNMETIDIYNVITLRLDVPEEMKREGGKGVVERIQEWARNSPLGKADPGMYRKVKTDKNLI